VLRIDPIELKHGIHEIASFAIRLAERMEVLDPQQTARAIAHAVTEWVESGMAVENFLFLATGQDEDDLLRGDEWTN
jgi:hypothetical protein